MGWEERRVDSLGKAKPLPFGEELRRAIREEFGTAKEFALRLGVSGGRVSQILGEAESLTAKSLEDVLNAFPNLAHREAVHAAWVRTFAPSALQELSQSESTEEAWQLLQSKDRLMSEGLSRQTLAATEALRTRMRDREMRFELARASIELCLFLGRSAQARRLSEELTERAKENGEPGWIARGLWLQANAGRNSPEAQAREIAETHERALEFASAWSPRDLGQREVLKDVRQALSRDRALAILAIHERRPVGAGQLEQAVRGLETLLEQDLEPHRRSVFLEVRGRVCLALGDTLEADDVIEEAKTVQAFVSPDHEAKAGILKAQLLLSRGNRDQGTDLLVRLLDYCYRLDDLHHARALERILARNR